MRTRQQERAAEAYRRVVAVKDGGSGKTELEQYGRQCLRLPAMIQQAGLCQAVAFLQAKAKSSPQSPFAMALTDLAGVMGEADLPRTAREANLVAYLQLTREALRSAEWMKRYAEAELKARPGDDGATAGGTR